MFDRSNGRPLFAIEERPVPASDVPGESASRTQPFPSKPVTLVPQQITEADIRGATPEDREACLKVFRALLHEGAFTPPSIQGSLLAPGNIGGLHWGGMAYDASNRLLIAPVNSFPAIVRLIPRTDFDAARKAFPSRETTAQNGAPFGMSREFFWAPSGAPCIAPPWGELVAVRVDSGELAWRVPLGDLRGLSITSINSTNYPQPTGSPNLGGPAATETGIAFIGATLDPTVRAFDTKNGKEIWSARLPTSSRATPLVFTTGNRQMVAIAAGGHDHSLSRIDTKLIVFALDAKP
jgi:quinoprotein glucose dehydrogenase